MDHDIDQRILTFKEQLQASGHRVTHQRVEVFREVIQDDRHPDAETVYLGVKKRVTAISRNTVYQTLQFLVEQGQITPFGIHQTSHRYDRNTSPHHHLVCTHCGRVTDCETDTLPLPTPEQQQKFSLWGDVKSVHLEFQGICSNCQKGAR
ncbi:MAG: transcriptional repressor [Magnetococcales bacterium]|nr:transcriptional repressor [Magnetococcales bacterium]